MRDWVCSCGEPWQKARHRARMARLIGTQWRGSPALLVPYRQWIREKLPNGNEGFVCCGDDGFIRAGFDPRDPRDIGELVAVEWKTHGRRLDIATERALAALELGRVRGTLTITLHGGNVPGPLSHFPEAREIAENDSLPEQPEVARRIVINDNWTRRNEEVTEAELIAAMKNAAGYVNPRTRCPGSGAFAGRRVDKSTSVWRAACPECGQLVGLTQPLDGGPDAQLDAHEAA